MEDVMKRHTILMAVSGFLALTSFIIANFTDLLYGMNELAGVIQIGLNVVVFLSYLNGYIKTPTGQYLKKTIAFFGVILPPIMAGITIYRVLL